MISPQTNLECLGKLGMMRFFPVRDNAVAEVGKLLNELCLNDHEAKRLAGIICGQCAEWPGPARVREIHAAEIANHRPKAQAANACEKCFLEIPGWRRVFRAIERDLQYSPVDGLWIYPDNGSADAESRKRLEVKRQYGTTHRVYEMMTACTCSRGKQIAAEARVRVKGSGR